MKRKISAKEFLVDVRAGLTDVKLMDKYDLSVPAIHALFKKLVESGLMSNQELEKRMPLTERSVSLEVFRCPACNMPQFTRFEECPQCGVIVKKLAPVSQPAAPDPKPPETPTVISTPPEPTPQEPERVPETPVNPPNLAEGPPDPDQVLEDPATDTPPHDPSRQPGNTIKISVVLPTDMLNELNGLGGDLSNHVTDAVNAYLAERRKAQTNPE